MKALLKLVGLLLLLVVLAVGGAFFYLDRIATVAVERGGTYALGVQTTLGSASVRPLAGHVGLSNLRVANPQGYAADYFLTIGDASLDVEVATLTEPLVRSSRFAIDGVRLALERNADGANYNRILDNLSKFESGDAPEPAGDAGPGKQFVIEEVSITDVNADVTLFSVGNKPQKLSVHVPEILLHDVGSGGGVDMAELADVIVKAVLESVVKTGDLPAMLARDLGGSLEKLTAVTESLGGQAQGITKEATDKLNEGLGKALDGLFGNKKD